MRLPRRRPREHNRIMALSAKDEAEIERLVQQDVLMTMTFGRRLAWFGVRAVVFFAVLAGVWLVCWPAHRGAVIWVAVGVSVGLLTMGFAVVAPARTARWMVRMTYVSDEDAKRWTMIP